MPFVSAASGSRGRTEAQEDCDSSPPFRGGDACGRSTLRHGLRASPLSAAARLGPPWCPIAVLEEEAGIAAIGHVHRIDPALPETVTFNNRIASLSRHGISGTADPKAWIGDIYAHALAYIDTLGVEVPQGVRSCIPGPRTDTPRSFGSAFTGYAVPGQPIRASLVASVSGGALETSDAFAGVAWTDPVIGISPSCARRDDFRIVFSEGVTAVPEPSSF